MREDGLGTWRTQEVAATLVFLIYHVTETREIVSYT